MLTREEKNLLSQIAADRESGNHLLRPRSMAYKEMVRELYRAISEREDKRIPRQKELVEEYESNFYN